MQYVFYKVICSDAARILVELVDIPNMANC